MESKTDESVSSSLRWADEIDDNDSDSDDMGFQVSHQKQVVSDTKPAPAMSKERWVDAGKERSIVDMNDRSPMHSRERFFGISRERSFAEVSAESRFTSDGDRQKPSVIDSDRNGYSRDRDSMNLNRRASRNPKKAGNRKGRPEQQKYEEGSWRSSSSFGDGNMRKGYSFNSRDDDRGFYGMNRRSREENGSSW